MPSGAVVVIGIAGLLAAGIFLARTARRSRALWAAAFDGSPVPALFVASDGTVRAVNPAFRRWSGIGDSADVRSVLSAALVPNTPSTPASLHQALSQGQPWHGDLQLVISGESRHADGWLVPAGRRGRSILWLDLAGAIPDPGQGAWTSEREALSDIDRSILGVADLDAILDLILRHTRELIRADWSGVLTVDAVNRRAAWRMIRGGRTAQDAAFDLDDDLLRFLGPDADHVVADDTPGVPEFIRRLMEQEQLRVSAWSPLMVGGEEAGALAVGYRSRRAPEPRDLRLLASLAEKSAIAMLNARRYERVLERERDLEKLSIARVEAQEDERRRIAKEIHDGIGQMLTAIKFNLEILEDSVPSGTEESGRVRDMKGVLDNLMREAREMSYALMPSVLEDFGLAPALQMLCEQFGAKHEVRTVFQNHGLKRRLRPILEISMYRIAQDVLANVARHAEASEVTVQVIRGADRLRLVIEDNGKGIASSGAPLTGLGFVSMRERAAQFGGTLTVDSSPGEGTVISVDIPLAQEDQP